MKYTNGPWKQLEKDPLKIKGPDKLSVACVVSQAGKNGRPYEQKCANARLISKSPEMLKCLKYLIAMIDEAPFELSNDQEKYRVYAHEIIEKVEGNEEL